MRYETSLGTETHLTTLETPGLGNRSYVAATDGCAIAVDVPRDIDRVERILADHGLRLAAVAETHLHNDYVTGGLALARKHGAPYYVPAGQARGHDRVEVGESDWLPVGPATVRVIAAPGHTDAHVVFSLHEGDAPAVAAFTGGSLLQGGMGRTDLLGPDRTEELARSQYWSIRRLARLLPGGAQVLPTHGFGSYCRAGDGPTKSVGTTVAEQLEVSPAFLLDEAAFVANLLANPSPIPRYFAAMAPRNLAGPEAADVTAPALWSSAQVAAWGVQRGWIIDTRPRAESARSHFPGSIGVDANGALAVWAGWTVPVDDPIVLVTADQQHLGHARRELSRVGFDHVVAGHVGPPARGSGITTPRTTFREAAKLLRSRREVAFLDVRDDAEWRQGHIAGAQHVAAHLLDRHVRSGGPLPDLPWVHCRSGYRAAVATSLLGRLGRDAVLVDDAVVAARRNAIPWCSGGGCPDDRCLADVTRALPRLARMSLR